MHSAAGTMVAWVGLAHYLRHPPGSHLHTRSNKRGGLGSRMRKNLKLAEVVGTYVMRLNLCDFLVKSEPDSTLEREDGV